MGSSSSSPSHGNGSNHSNHLRDTNSTDRNNMDNFTQRFQMFHVFGRVNDRHQNFTNTAADMGLYSESLNEMNDEFAGLSFNPPNESEEMRNLSSNFNSLFTSVPSPASSVQDTNQNRADDEAENQGFNQPSVSNDNAAITSNDSTDDRTNVSTNDSTNDSSDASHITNESDMNSMNTQSGSNSSSDLDKLLAECEAWKSKGNSFFKSTDYSKSIECYEKAITVVQDQNQHLAFRKLISLCYSNKAAAKFCLKDYASALIDCNIAIELDSTFVKAKIRAAKCTMMLGGLDQALALSEQCIRECKTLDEHHHAAEVMDSIKTQMKKQKQQHKQKHAQHINQMHDQHNEQQHYQHHEQEHNEQQQSQSNQSLSSCLPTANSNSSCHMQPNALHSSLNVNVNDSACHSESMASPNDSTANQASTIDQINQSSNVQEESTVECELLRSRGNQLFKENNYEDAIQSYNEAIALCQTKRSSSGTVSESGSGCSPWDQAASVCYHNRAVVKIQLQKYGSALSDCRVALHLNPQYTRAQIRAAKCFLMFGLADQAFDLSNESIKELNKEEDNRMGREIRREAQALRECYEKCRGTINGNDIAYTDALESIEKTLEAYPLSVIAADLKAQLLLKLRNFNQAKALCQSTRIMIEEALAPLTQSNFEFSSSPASSSSSTSSSTSSFLLSFYFLCPIPSQLKLWQKVIHGRACYGEETIEKALGILKDAENDFRNLTLNGTPIFFQKNFNLPSYVSDLEKMIELKLAGNKFFKESKLEDAIRAYSTALEIPNISESRTFCAIVFYNRASSWNRMKSFSNAMDDCSSAIALHPTYDRAISRRVDVSREVRDYGRAISDLETLIRLAEEKKNHSIMSRHRPTSTSSNSEVDVELNKYKRLLGIVNECNHENVPPNHYLILGLDPSNQSSKCKGLYFKLAIKHHPDKASNFLPKGDRKSLGDVIGRLAKEKEHYFKLIQNANSVLHDPETRSRFDEEENLRNSKKRGFESGSNNNNNNKNDDDNDEPSSQRRRRNNQYQNQNQNQYQYQYQNQNQYQYQNQNQNYGNFSSGRNGYAYQQQNHGYGAQGSSWGNPY